MHKSVPLPFLPASRTKAPNQKLCVSKGGQTHIGKYLYTGSPETGLTNNSLLPRRNLKGRNLMLRRFRILMQYRL